LFPPGAAGGYEFWGQRTLLCPNSSLRGGLHLWLKEVAPSDELRKWFGHDPGRWDEFKPSMDLLHLVRVPDSSSRRPTPPRPWRSRSWLYTSISAFDSLVVARPSISHYSCIPGASVGRTENPSFS